MTQRTPLDLTFIGSGNAFAPERCWSGFLLNGRYAFDAPPTLLVNLKKLGVDLAAIDTVLLSHFHADHFFGLPFLLLEYAYLTKRTSDLTIVGPPGVEQKVEGLLDFGYPGLRGRDLGYHRHYIELRPDTESEVNGLRFRPMRVKHGEGKLECFGFQTWLGDRRLAYTGDTAWFDGLVTLAADMEVFVTDCTYAKGHNLPEHLSFDEVRDLRGRIDPATAMILTHLGGHQTNHGLERVYVARDFASFSLP